MIHEPAADDQRSEDVLREARLSEHRLDGQRTLRDVGGMLEQARVAGHQRRRAGQGDAHHGAAAVALVLAVLMAMTGGNGDRTAENIAAALHPAIDADSRLAEVRQALVALEKGLMVRRGDDGYELIAGERRLRAAEG